MKIHSNPNLPHFMHRNRTQTVPQKCIAEPPRSIDALLARNQEALDRLQDLRPGRTNKTSS